MIRVVLDVNVIVSGFPAPNGIPGILVRRWLRGNFEVIVSDHILSGVRRAWENPYFAERYDQAQAARALRLIRRHAITVDPATSVHGFAEDEEDDLVVATAVAGQAGYLVTGDKWLLRMGRYNAIEILSPREFLTRLDEGSAS
jgi:putative PIN family toxin of toxin-antitoxin system